MLRKGRWRGGVDRRPRHGGDRSGRFFDYGEIRHVVLALLSEQPRHGYDIIRAIEQRTAGVYCPSPGVIYPTLALLEDVGHVRAANGEGARNRYHITDKGRAALVENRRLIDSIFARLQPAGAAKTSASPLIVAAMDRLKSALRSGARPWSADEAKAIGAVIDAAAESIRRLRKHDRDARE
jgi:DNA-binding PadR family transcriptional regulator